MIFCRVCGGDINAMGMDNVSPISGWPVCEACASEMTDDDWSILASCDDCAHYRDCPNYYFNGKICGDFEKE